MKCSPLNYDPFDGDFGDQGDKILSDKIVTAKWTHKCFHCGEVISIGESHRSRVDIIDGSIVTYRWCAKCCAAMIVDMEDKTGMGEAMENRHGFK